MTIYMKNERIMKNKEEIVKNPLLDSVDEDMSRMPIRLSFFEKI